MERMERELEEWKKKGRDLITKVTETIIDTTNEEEGSVHKHFEDGSNETHIKWRVVTYDHPSGLPNWRFACQQRILKKIDDKK